MIYVCKLSNFSEKFEVVLQIIVCFKAIFLIMSSKKTLTSASGIKDKRRGLRVWSKDLVIEKPFWLSSYIPWIQDNTRVLQ